jgi:hypothetical protein
VNTKGGYKGDNDEYNAHVDDDTRDHDVRNTKMMIMMIMRMTIRWM